MEAFSEKGNRLQCVSCSTGKISKIKDVETRKSAQSDVCVCHVFERPLIVVATSLAHQKVRAGDMTTATTNGQVAATLGFSCLWPLLSVCARRCLLIIKGRSHRSPLMWLLSFLGKKLECST